MKRLVTALCLSITFVVPVRGKDKPLFAVRSTAKSAAAGEYVLCPSRQFYERAMESGADKTTFIYYAATMVDPGSEVSVVRSLAGQEFALPNQLMIPIPRKQTAKIGDVVLSWWQSGSGMQRCIVVGGTESEPTVRYLDIAYENPSGAGRKEETLKPDSFYVLKEAWQLGRMIQVDAGGQQRVGQLLAIDDEHILLREFAGRLKQYKKTQATPMPLQPDLSVGVAAQAALFGSLKPVTVTKVDAKIGRVWATYQLGRSEKEKAFSFGEIRSE